MKKILTTIVLLSMVAGVRMLAQTFPDDPGTLVVDLYVQAALYDGDTISIPTTGSGSYAVGTEVTLIAGERAGYRFVSWSDTVTASTRTVIVTQSMTYVAYYERILYAVAFVDADSTVLSTQEYYYDEYPAVPSEEEMPYHEPDGRYTYVFSGWNPAVDTVRANVTYQAVYDTIVNTYEVRFYKDAETLLEADTLTYGAMPTYNGATPTRADEMGVRYVFEGWEPELHSVEGDAEYYAIFTEVEIEYDVRIVLNLEGDTTYYKSHYRDQLSLEAVVPNYYRFAGWSDGETANPRVLVVTSDTVVIAMFEEATLKVPVAADAWTFVCMPTWSSVASSPSYQFAYEGLEGVTWGTYSGERRASAQSGWEVASAEEGFSTPGQGYILYSKTSGTLHIMLSPKDLIDTTATIELKAYEAEHAQNANWNFVGNPFYGNLSTANISIDGTSDASITVWNGTGYSNELIGTDGGATIEPLQAFFVQTAEAGVLYMYGGAASAPRRKVSAVSTQDGRIDITATAGGYSDRARVLLRANSKLRYEAGRDAAKFVTATAPVQMWFVDVDNIECAQMVRPAGSDNMRLGYMLREAGEMTIEAPMWSDDYQLYDALTGRYYDLSETVVVYSEAGTYNDRFELRPVQRVVTDVDAVEQAAFVVTEGGIVVLGTAPVSVYTLLGQHVCTQEQQGVLMLNAGTYVLVSGGSASKVVLR